MSTPESDVAAKDGNQHYHFQELKIKSEGPKNRGILSKIKSEGPKICRVIVEPKLRGLKSEVLNYQSTVEG